MNLTLGGQAQQRPGLRAPAADAVMTEGGASSDPLQTAARNDGPRQSVVQQVDMATVVEALEVNGEIPQARFGHTITIVSK